MRGRHRSARIGPAARAYLQRVGRRGSALGVVAVVALVPVVASAAMVVPSIATASSTEGTDISGVAAALAGQVDADPTMTADIAGSDSSDVAAKGSNGSTESCPPAPAGAQAVAPADSCAASEPPPADAAGAASAAVGSPNAGTVAAPVSVGGGLVFDAGNIVSDAVFYNGAAMTDEQIASFIAEQGAGCAGEWCLKNLRVDVAAQPADEFCAAIPRGRHQWPLPKRKGRLPVGRDRTWRPSPEQNLTLLPALCPPCCRCSIALEWI